VVRVDRSVHSRQARRTSRSPRSRRRWSRTIPPIAPSMLYAYAALMENVPCRERRSNLTVDVPALERLAEERRLPIGGKDFKTGQTMMKTVLAPAFKARMLGLAGWYRQYSGQPGRRSPRRSRIVQDEGGVQARGARVHPAAGPVSRAVRQTCSTGADQLLPPRGDNKEGWDNIDIFGWLAIRCRSRSTSCAAIPSFAAPIVLTWRCSSTWRSGHGSQGSRSGCRSTSRAADGPGVYPEHDLFIQQTKLKNTLRWLMARIKSPTSASSTTRRRERLAVRRHGRRACRHRLGAVVFPACEGSVTGRHRRRVQEVRVVVKGGYTPDTIVVRAGEPVRLQFYRDETADCSERVVFEDFGIDARSAVSDHGRRVHTRGGGRIPLPLRHEHAERTPRGGARDRRPAAVVLPAQVP